ncbi:MAG: rRNA maturation RNase YbeY [Thermoleophilia bacterium]
MSAVGVEVVNLTSLAIDGGAVTRLVAGVLGGEGVTSGELGVRFVGVRRMRALNREYLGHDEVTDVLAFPLEDAGEALGEGGSGGGDSDAGDEDAGDEDDGVPGDGESGDGSPAVPRLLGDVVVCQRRAASQARAAGTPLAFEIAMLLVHGTLHVLGHDHETDAGEMALRQARHLDDASWERLLGED